MNDLIIIFLVLLISKITNINSVLNHPNWPKDTHNECGISYADRIIGGTNASLGQYPWLARIGYNRNSTIVYECGGALISKIYVITAAHCVTNLDTHTKIQSIALGENNALTEIDCEHNNCADPIQYFHPGQIIYPSNYNKPMFKHDIALIKLNKPVKLSEWVLPVCLPYGDNLKCNLNGEIGEVAGWGLTDSDDTEGTPILQTVKLPILDIKQCIAIYGSSIKLDDEQLCVGGLIGKDSCAGDSGGPLVKVMSSEEGPRYFLYGIVSFGSKRCGETPTPGIYTNIKHYMTWILENLK